MNQMRILNTLHSLILIAMIGGTGTLMAQTGLSLDQSTGAEPSSPSSGSISLSPNPFDQQVTVRFHELRVRGTVDVDLVDLRNGQVMLTRQIVPRNGLVFNTSDLVQGRYDVIVRETSSGRIVARASGSRVVAGNVEMNDTPTEVVERTVNETPVETKAMARLAFHAFPNPFSDQINVRFDTRKVQDLVQISLRNTQNGEVVLKQNADPRQQAVLLTNALPKGLYVLEVRDLTQGFLIGSMQMRN